MGTVLTVIAGLVLAGAATAGVVVAREATGPCVPPEQLGHGQVRLRLGMAPHPLERSAEHEVRVGLVGVVGEDGPGQAPAGGTSGADHRDGLRIGHVSRR